LRKYWTCATPSVSVALVAQAACLESTAPLAGAVQASVGPGLVVVPPPLVEFCTSKYTDVSFAAPALS
jgi:hypothetical protein